jgi:putative zinc finger/helix-turn-helix YgiT family protein
LEGEFERCQGECGEVFYAPGEMDDVMKRASALIRQREHMLTPGEIKSIRSSLGVTQHQFEELLGAGPKTVVRWERGTVIQNGATNTLLLLLRDVPEARTHLLRMRGIEPKVVPLVPATKPISYRYVGVTTTRESFREAHLAPAHEHEAHLMGVVASAMERIA